MAKEEVSRLLEDKIRLRLDSEGIKYRYHDKIAGFASPEIDFLVLSPMLLVIEVITDVGRNRDFLFRKKLRRDIANRISIAEQYGSDILVVAILPDTQSEDIEAIAKRYQIAFDAVYTIETMPSIGEIIRQQKVNPYIKYILSNGYPKDYSLSNPEDIDAKWSNALTIADLLDPQLKTINSLGTTLHEYVLEQSKNIDIEPIRTISGPKTNKSAVSNALIMNPSFFEGFDRILFKEISRQGGGHIRTERFDTPSSDSSNVPPFSIKLSVWRYRGKNAVIRRQQLGETAAVMKIRELTTDAWLIRSSNQNMRSLVLLLGSTSSKYSDHSTINALEAAGWSVFPWDFDLDEPSIIKFLNSL
jgi:hypothetical protein